MPDPIFVFGSNLAGRHGRGAAQWAVKHRGAIYSRGQGLQGRAYAIPTKDANLVALPLGSISIYVAEFLRFARTYPELEFELTAIGCGLAGYQPEQIAPMFADAPENVRLPVAFHRVLHPEEFAE